MNEYDEFLGGDDQLIDFLGRKYPEFLRWLNTYNKDWESGYSGDTFMMLDAWKAGRESS